MSDLVQRAELLNALTRRRLEIESQVRMVDGSTSLRRIQALKREHARVVQRLERLERSLR